MVFLKLFHLFFVFIWVGSLLFLTRAGSMLDKQALRKMYFTIDLPAMLLAISTGMVCFIVKCLSFKGGWLHMKLTMVFFLIIVDIFAAKAILSAKPMSKKYSVFLHALTFILLFLILFSIYVLKPLSVA